MEFTHLDQEGKAIMVDISQKNIVKRRATANGFIRLNSTTIDLIEKSEIKKGDVFACARIAGIMSAKKTSDLIPLCHPIYIESVTVDFKISDEKDGIFVVATATTSGKTGIEMEVLTAVSTSLLTIYDMCKAVDKNMKIESIHLVSKEKNSI